MGCTKRVRDDRDDRVEGRHFWMNRCDDILIETLYIANGSNLPFLSISRASILMLLIGSVEALL